MKTNDHDHQNQRANHRQTVLIRRDNSMQVAHHVDEVVKNFWNAGRKGIER